MTTESGEMSFLDHLEELRWRVIKALIAVVVCAIPCGVFWRRIFDLALLYPLHAADPRPRIIMTAPAESVILSLKIAIAGGVICATPVVFYQIWKFISPGLYSHERIVVFPSVVASTLCFLTGVGFSYLVLPYVMKFLAGYASGTMEPYFKANEYMGFLIRIVLAFGLVFELPVISYILTKAGLLTPGFLIRQIRYAVVVMFVLAAILTPPDVVSQVFLALPLLVLYLISIVVSFSVQRAKKAA